MLTADTVLYILSVSLFATACALFVGAKLVSRHPDLVRRSIRIDFSRQVSILLVGAVVSAVVANQTETDVVDLESLPATAAGIQVVPQAVSATSDQSGLSGVAAVFPDGGRYQKTDPEQRRAVQIEMLADSLNAYLLVMQPDSNDSDLHQPELITATLVREDGDWYLRSDEVSQWPSWLPPEGVVIDVARVDEGLELRYEQDGQSVTDYWQRL